MRAAGPPLSDWTWRWLGGFPTIAAIEIANRREAVAALCRAFAPSGVGPGIEIDALTAGGHKRPRTRHEVDLFRWITEGRGWGKAYSTCGDGVGGIYCCLGLRSEQILNRNDDNIDGIDDPRFPASEPTTSNDRPSVPAPAEWWDVGGTKAWRVGWNLTMIRQGAIDTGCWVRAKDGQLPQVGDAFLVDYGTSVDHVGLIVEGPDEVADGVYRYLTCEAGQVDAGGQCFKLYETHYKRSGSSVIMERQAPLKRRVLDGFIDLAKLPLDAPALVPPGFTVGAPV